MTAFLRFTLYAPLASWGDTAVGEVRGSWDRPSRSAILGLIGAALGIRRDEATSLRQLDDSIGVAVRSLALGESMVDYHTAQNPKARHVAKELPRTRRSALQLGEPDTTLSRRWLRQDAIYLVAIWQRPTAALTMEELQVALRAPRFTLYAGRKANVLGLPLCPMIVEASSLAGALQGDPDLPHSFAALKLRGAWGQEVAHDLCEGFQPGLVASQAVARRDASPARDRWQFSERTMYVGRIPERSP